MNGPDYVGADPAWVGPVGPAAVAYANARGITLGAPALWIADQLRAEGFHHVELVTIGDMPAEQWDALHRTFRWGMGLPIGGGPREAPPKPLA